MKKKILFAAASIAICLLITDLVLRLLMPDLAADLFPPGPHPDSPYFLSDRLGYDMRPNAVVEIIDTEGTRHQEMMNSDGFRGPERITPKPLKTFRILAIGDSVVQAFSVTYDNSWERILEGRLGDSSEVINAGIGGYVSWQALRRFEDRGGKYQADLVLLSVGVNDMCYSSLPTWKPDLNLSQIERAHESAHSEQQSKGWWSSIRILLYRYSFTARLIRHVRSQVWNSNYQNELIRLRQNASGTPFNVQALELFEASLERTYQVASERKTRMGVMVWSSLLTKSNLQEDSIHRKLLMLYSNFPLSTREVLVGFRRYQQAIRDFANRHPDVVLIDVEAALAPLSLAERHRLFSDHVHYTVEGNNELARIVHEVLKQQGICR
jgi:lysophospholipase L1-like esterase